MVKNTFGLHTRMSQKKCSESLFVHDIYLVAIFSRTAPTTALVEESNLPDSRMNRTR